MTTHSDDKPILIVGGGIGGFAAALALSQKGRRVRLFEQAPEFQEVGAGIQMGPNVFKRFERLGVRDAIDAVAVYPENLIMRDALSGDDVACLPLGQGICDRFGYPYAVIHRADLHSVLIDASKDSDLIELTPSTKIVDYTETADGVVARSETEEYEGAALIACDGLWSAFREQIVGDGKPRVSGHIAYRAVLPADEVPQGQYENNVVLWAGPKTHLVHYPLRRGELFNLVAVFHSDRYEEGWNAAGDPEELFKRFHGQQDKVNNLLSKIESWRMWVLCDREPVHNWSKGRATLLGDAAHPMLQYLAQGAGMAIEDACVLSDELEKADGHYAAAFQRYQDDRYLRTGRVQLFARYYGDIYHAAGVTRELRNAMLSGLGANGSPYEGMAWLYGA